MITFLVVSIASLVPSFCSTLGLLHVDVSNEIIEKLNPLGDVPWRFFEHSESKKIFAENADEKDTQGWTALHYTTYENLPEIATALIEANVDIDAINNEGFTALHLAAMENCLKIGEILIDANADLNTKNDYQNTPLDVANEMGHTEFVQMLQNKM
jgi:ankyrin repeat protein